MSRYTITKEFVGDSKPHYVVRFCGDWVESHRLKVDAVQSMRDHATGWRPRISAHRPPTPSEIRRGYGATHYADFDHGEWLKDNGEYKMRMKSHVDGLIYSRF
jgi:hypothetical protein